MEGGALTSLVEVRLARSARRRSEGPRLLVVAARLTPTNRALVSASRRLGVQTSLLRPVDLVDLVQAGDVILSRLDVLPTLDGVDFGLGELSRVSERGIRVLNQAATLLAAHDKLTTTHSLAAAGVPHPVTVHVDEPSPPPLDPPLVVKPRFGSWGKDVVLCETAEDVETTLRMLAGRPWFRRHGALVQELVPPQGRDLRLIVAGDEVVGAVERIAAPGEWRTNIALGGTRRRIDPPDEACSLALDAARAIEGDLVGVDVLPDGAGGYVVLELNGAAEFTEEYSLGGRDVFERALAGAHAELAVAPLAAPADVEAALGSFSG